MPVIKIKKELTPRENLLNLIKESNKDNPLIDTLTADSFIVQGISANTALGNITVDGIEIKLNSSVTLIGNPIKGWTGTKIIKYRRVDLTDWNYPDIVGSTSARIPRATICSTLGLIPLQEKDASIAEVGKAMVVAGSTQESYLGPANQWALKEYLNLHQTLKVSMSTNGNMAIYVPSNDLETDGTLSSKVMYVNTTTMYIS